MKTQTMKALMIMILMTGLYSCSHSQNSNSSAEPAPQSSGSGKAGSMARMLVVDRYLYTLNGNTLRIFDLAIPNDPQAIKTLTVTWNVETLFSMKHYLFIGSSTGMSIYDIKNPKDPEYISDYSHFKSCDPVVAEGKYAYSTLRSGTSCRNGRNELHIMDISDIQNPVKIQEYPLSNPHGLAVDGRLLFIADGTDGLKVFDVRDKDNIRRLERIANLGETYDVIAYNKKLILISSEGLYQYDYSRSPLKFLSYYPIGKLYFGRNIVDFINSVSQ